MMNASIFRQKRVRIQQILWGLVGLTMTFAVAHGASVRGSGDEVETTVEDRTELLDDELSGWVLENAPATNFTVSDGILRVVEREGWLRSSDTYTDFHLRVEFRFLTKNADSGIFVRASAEGTFARGWPRQSYQVQMLNPEGGEGPFPPIGAVFRHGVPRGTTTFDSADAKRLSRATGEWQTLEVKLAGEDLTVWLNGEQLTVASEITAPGHHIGIQSETGEIEFRSISIREL